MGHHCGQLSSKVMYNLPHMNRYGYLVGIENMGQRICIGVMDSLWHMGRDGYLAGIDNMS